MTKKVETEAPAGVYELLAEFRSKLGTDKETGGRVKEAELYAAAVAGEPLVAVTSFKSAGTVYEPGDPITLAADSRLLDARWVTTGRKWTEGQAARARALFYRDEVGPAEALASKMVREESEAHRAAEAARIAAVDAQLAATRASDRRELAENELLLTLLNDGGQS